MGHQGQKDGARFAVGFFYAGENRALVAPLAEELARRWGVSGCCSTGSMKPSWPGSIWMCTCPGFTGSRQN